MFDYCNDWNYSVFLSESMINRTHFVAAIQESVLTAQDKNTVQNMFVVTEGVAEKVKSAIAKIVAALARIWGRFTEAISALVKRDKNYLIKYKDIILKKAFAQDYTFKMYNYQAGQKYLLGTFAPAFNLSSLEPKLENEDVFVQSYFPSVDKIQKANKDLNFQEAAKILFRGSDAEQNIASSKFNMTDAYNYCVAYESISKKLEVDSKNIKAAASQVQQKIEKMQREEKSQQPATNTPNQSTTPNTNTQQQSTQPQSNETAQKEFANLFEYGSYVSYLYENTVINEVEITTGETKQTATSGAPKATSDPSKAVLNKVGQDSDHVENNQVNDKSVEKIKLYIKVVGELMTAKMQVAEEMYKEYMKIIRAHVKDHVGKKDTATDKPEDKATVQGVDTTNLDTSKLPG